MKNFLLLPFVAILLLLANIPADASEFQVGVLDWSMNIPGQVAMRKGLETETAEINKAAQANGKPAIRLEVREAGDGEVGIPVVAYDQYISGQKAAKEILHDFPQTGTIDVVFTVNDGGGLSVVKVLATAGRSEIMVATIDGDPTSVNNIIDRRLTVIDAAQFCGPLGAEAMKAAYTLLTGGKPPNHALIPVFPVTLEKYKATMA